MHILVLNAGSSSLKFALDRGADAPRWRGEIEPLFQNPRFRAGDGRNHHEAELPRGAGHREAVDFLLDWLDAEGLAADLAAAGHRVVHGGPDLNRPARVDEALLDRLHRLEPLAPLHLPHNLAAIEALRDRHPALPQVACFDTAFHRDMPWEERVYALPLEWYEQGVQRYGFHGLSYEYIASVLPQYLGAQADGRVVVAHLGHGASLCALHRRRSRATTMGFTPLDGVPMATRPGQLDPGIVPWLLRRPGMDLEAVETLLNRRSGLLGLSGISGDMRELLASAEPAARRAVDCFVYRVARAVASLAGALGGIDALVFTGGIGEHAPTIRAAVAQRLAWLGLRLDAEANRAGAARISTEDSPLSAWRIATDEEAVIIRHTRDILHHRETDR